MGRTPFFSIIIPTYNRANLLKATIAICLNQTFQDYEIIISNNCSTDNTKDVVKSFTDKRIRYYENKKNIGFEQNVVKLLSYARGKYIFTIGDDDFILYENTLDRVKKVVEEKKYGFVRLNLIERKFIGKGIRKSIVTCEKDIEINKNASTEEIIDFFIQTGAGHFAGLVMKNYPGLSKMINNCPVFPWIKIFYFLARKNGTAFLANYYMVITWSQGGILNHYDVPKNNRLMFEGYTDFIFSIIPKERLNSYKLKYFRSYILLQPVIKLYSSNRNLLKFDKRLLKLEPRLKYNIFFWLSFTIAIIFPKQVWEIVRVIQHSNKNVLDQLEKKEQIYKKFHAINKKYYLI